MVGVGCKAQSRPFPFESDQRNPYRRILATTDEEFRRDVFKSTCSRLKIALRIRRKHHLSCTSRGILQHLQAREPETHERFWMNDAGQHDLRRLLPQFWSLWASALWCCFLRIQRRMPPHRYSFMRTITMPATVPQFLKLWNG